ncbi:MAG: RNA pyrophosphohydrolase [Gammaproteobacteria bacterium]|nr:RNA pyrophosphohydrolase [Gammaproteobacteria bacterium]
MIDKDGFRYNVGIILANDKGKLFWGRRIGQDAWQFPQGGMRRDETHEQAMYRELEEEIGLQPEHVEVLGVTKDWLRYRLPQRLIRHDSKPTCVGQRQIWYLLRLVGSENDLRLDFSEKPEFDGWRWVQYWYPVTRVVPFKRKVYKKALSLLKPHLADMKEPVTVTESTS